MYLSINTLIIAVALSVFSSSIQSFRPTFVSIRSIAKLSMSTFYDITETDGSGAPVSFSKFKGKVVYGVNVASKVILFEVCQIILVFFDSVDTLRQVMLFCQELPH